MEEARAVLVRLERIEALDRAEAEPQLVLAELRELVREVEVWAKREGDPCAGEAARLLAEHAVARDIRHDALPAHPSRIAATVALAPPKE